MNEMQSLCFLCQQPLKSPLKTSCQHVFCQKCILNWVTENLMCPCNCGILFTNELIKVQDLNSISENLHYRCPNYKNGCPLILMKKDIKSHVKNECKFPRNISMNSQNSTSKENLQNPIDKISFLKSFLENFLEKLQISNFIQPQIDVINEFLNLLVFIENIRVSQMKFIDIMGNIYKKEDKSLVKEFREIKENLQKIDLKPLNSHLLLISDKINVYIENAKLAYQNCKKKKPQTSIIISNKPSFFENQNYIKKKSPKKNGFLTSPRENLFAKTSKIPAKLSKEAHSQPNIPKKQLKNIVLDKKDESFEKAKKRLLLQQNRLFKITSSRGGLNESLKESKTNINDNKINSGSQHYLLNKFSKNNASKRSSASRKNSNSIKKTFIDLTMKKHNDSPFDINKKSGNSSNLYERYSNRFKRSDRSIKNTTSSSSASNKVYYFLP